MNNELIAAKPFNAKATRYELAMIASQVSDELECGKLTPRTMARIRDLVNHLLIARAIESARASSYTGN